MLSALIKQRIARITKCWVLGSHRDGRQRESVARETFKCFAAAVTFVSPINSRRTMPGCGGLCMRSLLVIIQIVDEDCILAFEPERQAPVPAHHD